VSWQQQGVLPLDGEVSPAATWDSEAARHAPDELFSMSRQYRSGETYATLLKFVSRFRFYSPFNAMLVHIQMPGAPNVAPPHRWLRDYDRRVKPGARPLVILQPMGPVMLVFDISDVDPEDRARPLPVEVERPFDARQGCLSGELELTIENTKRDGVSVSERDAGSQSAGELRLAEPGRHLSVVERLKPEPVHTRVPLRYELLVNAKRSGETKYATLAHELAHLYCGHLGTPNDRWWPDRRGVSPLVAEVEAESVSYVLCGRLGIDGPSGEYLGGHLGQSQETPKISLECVMKAAGLIEQMGRERLKPRKEKE
jgi:hypothetical protein